MHIPKPFYFPFLCFFFFFVSFPSFFVHLSTPEERRQVWATLRRLLLLVNYSLFFSFIYIYIYIYSYHTFFFFSCKRGEIATQQAILPHTLVSQTHTHTGTQIITFFLLPSAWVREEKRRKKKKKRPALSLFFFSFLFFFSSHPNLADAYIVVPFFNIGFVFLIYIYITLYIAYCVFLSCYQVFFFPFSFCLFFFAVYTDIFLSISFFFFVVLLCPRSCRRLFRRLVGRRCNRISLIYINTHTQKKKKEKRCWIILLYLSSIFINIFPLFPFQNLLPDLFFFSIKTTADIPLFFLYLHTPSLRKKQQQQRDLQTLNRQGYTLHCVLDVNRGEREGERK